ncbi:MAG: iron ABC transporter permease [bacterium]|nr:iron ABC transporter permease [bacterium]
MITRKRTQVLSITLVLGSLALMVASLLVGTESISIGKAIEDWQAGLSVRESPTLNILFQQRLPRTLTAIIAGCGLALAGCAFQALLRNPLATPYTLGVASAGALGAWTATILAQSMGMSPIFSALSTKTMAFGFAAVDIALIYFIAARRARFSSTVLLLAGVSMGMLANAGIMFMRYLAEPDKLVMMDRWLMGGVNVLGFTPVKMLAIGVTPCLVVLLLQASRFDQLGFGVEMAAGRGVNVPRLQLVTFLVGSLMVAIIVSEVGPIGFVGLIVPHAVRAFTGSRHRILMPLSMLAGGGFLCLCDIVARKLLTGETPIGIVTSMFGVPFFLYLLLRRRMTDWDE